MPPPAAANVKEFIGEEKNNRYNVGIYALLPKIIEYVPLPIPSHPIAEYEAPTLVLRLSTVISTPS